MHELALEQRRDLGVRAPWHVGDITWGLRQHEGREDEWTFRIWQDGGRTVAWSWLKGDRGLLEFDVRRDRLDLLDEILADPEARTSGAFEDDEEVGAALHRNGFTGDDDMGLTRQGSVMNFLARDLTEPPEPPELPDGFRYRTVEAGDLVERVAVHRDVWAPSRVTESSFANVQASWPYRASLDCVVAAPASPAIACSGRTTRIASASSSPSACVRNSGVAVSAPPSARSPCAAGTRKAAARRSSTASAMRRVRSTSRSASAATRPWSATRADASSAPSPSPTRSDPRRRR